MITSQLLGNVSVQPSGPCEYLTLGFSPLSAPLRSRWRNNGLSADFLSDYVLTFLPRTGDLAIPELLQKEVRHAVSYIANELLENAMKYHENRIGAPIQIHLELTSDNITISATNGVEPEQCELYRGFVNTLLTEDPGTLLMSQLESAGKGDSDASGLGLLTMINDYGVGLGWKFETNSSDDSLAVTTTATLPLKNILGGSL